MAKTIKKTETKVTITVSDETLAAILCCGIEGGIQYWAHDIRFTKDAEGLIDYSGLVAGDCEWGIKDGSTRPECNVGPDRATRQPRADGLYALNREHLQRGLQALYAEDKREFFNVLDPEKADADTGDALIQCALFGKTIYG